jgi:hypothetical protein
MNRVAFVLIVAGLWVPALVAVQWTRPGPPAPADIRVGGPTPPRAAAPALAGSSLPSPRFRPTAADPIDRDAPGADDEAAFERWWIRYRETFEGAERAMPALR